MQFYPSFKNIGEGEQLCKHFEFLYSRNILLACEALSYFFSTILINKIFFLQKIILTYFLCQILKLFIQNKVTPF